MEEVKVPHLAEAITEATLIDWRVAAGDYIEQGNVLAELETDKVNVEVYAPKSGVVTVILAEIDQDVKVGEVIAKIDTEVQGNEDQKKEAIVEEIAPNVKVTAEPTEEGTNLAANEANILNLREPADIISGPKASPAARKHHHFESQKDQPELDIASLKAATDDLLKATTAPAWQEEEPSRDITGNKVALLDQADPYLEKALQDPMIQVEKLSRRRRTIAENLLQTQQNMAMLTTFNEIDMSELIKLRKEVQADFKERHGVKLGYMSLFTKAVIAALKQFPSVNSEMYGDHLLLKQYYNIGIAVMTDAGLVVPVIKDADRKNFAQIEQDIADLAQKARDRELSLDDMQDGTFTITNGGTYGSLFSTPIINPPQVAILGMHNIQERPVNVNGQVVIRPMMYVALTYDHRVIDGRDSVRFLKHIKALLQDPKRLFLEG